MIKVLFGIVTGLYPFLLFYFIAIKKAEPQLLSLFVIAFVLFAFITFTTASRDALKKKAGLSPAAGSPASGSPASGSASRTNPLTQILPSLFLFGIGVAFFLTDSRTLLKFYPVLTNSIFLCPFAFTIFQPPSMIYRLAVLIDKTIPYSTGRKKIYSYCKKVTIVWISWFIINGSIAVWTIFYGSDFLWALYNGFLFGVIMTNIFIFEYIIRRLVQRKIPKVVPLTSLNKRKRKARPLSAVVCYSGSWSGSRHDPGKCKTWGDFLEGTAILRKYIQSLESDRVPEGSRSNRWLLYCDDYWLFLLAFTSLLQCKKEILLTANTSPEYINEIINMEQGMIIPFLTDQTYPEGRQPPNNHYIPDLLRASVPPCEEISDIPQINGDETSIIMYTSGSTGKPKAVRQRLTEFENDNKFILSKWADEFAERKLCSTVNQHHIYGLLFSILLPFTAGIPFKRERIHVPEEFENLNGGGEEAKYMIITVPAFLKRAVQLETKENLKLLSPWIFTSGGALDRNIAEKTAEVFGFWPIEVYGSTETSGIAWRQSVNGLEWTVFDNAEVSLNDKGCLVIKSLYIKDPNGFETADMAEILEDGRFLLKGRSDFVVKIEEKRISLTEIEERLLQSGYVQNACVIAMEDKRQYLAAVVSFNEKGKEKFSGMEKLNINRFFMKYLLQYIENQLIPKKWRYIDTLPLDSQGKINWDNMKKLFEKNTGSAALEKGGKYILNRVIKKTDDSAVIEFSIPKESPYFDGHFKQVSILPGVAQIELVSFFAKEHFNSNISIIEIKKVKFTNFIMPSIPIVIKLDKEGGKLAFKIYAADSENIYSFGTLIIKEE